MITVTFAKAFRRHVECPDELIEPAAGSSGPMLRDVLGAYFARHPGVRTYVLDDAGALRRHVTVFVDDEQLTHREALDRSVTPASTVYLFQALSGG